MPFFDDHEFEPDEDQLACMKDIYNWYKNSDQQIYYLAGYAGVGKTTVSGHVIVDYLGLDPDNKIDVMAGSYMAKVSIVMRRNGFTNATTIHQMIYIPEEDEKGDITFRFNHDSELKYTKLIVLDEISTVNEEISERLKSFGKKILVLGDPGQLRPVQGECPFTKLKPNWFLTKPHRFALNSPIIKLSMLARTGQEIPYGDYSEHVRVVDANAIDFQDLVDAEQVITGKNITRRILNKEINAAHGFTSDYPTRQGVKVICLRNQHDIGLINGMIGWTTGDKCHLSKNGKFFTQSIVDEDKNYYENLDISTGPFIEYKRERTIDEKRLEGRSKLSQFDFGSAITSYKAIGSQWGEIFFYDDGFGLWDRKLKAENDYTVITRAANKLTILRAY